MIAMIELTEGPRLMSRVITEPSSVMIDMEVEVRWATVAEDVIVPVFIPSGDEDGS